MTILVESQVSDRCPRATCLLYRFKIHPNLRFLHALIFMSNCLNIVTRYKIHTFVIKQSYLYYLCCHGKVQVGKDQEKAQPERDTHSKNRGGKKTKLTIRHYTMKHIVSRMSSYFPNRWPLSHLNLTKNMKAYIRRQQHKKI